MKNIEGYQNLFSHEYKSMVYTQNWQKKVKGKWK